MNDTTKQSESQLSAQVMANRLICMIDDIPIHKGQAAAIQRAHKMAFLLEQKLNAVNLVESGLLDRVREVLDGVLQLIHDAECDFWECPCNGSAEDSKPGYFAHADDCPVTKARALRAELGGGK